MNKLTFSRQDYIQIVQNKEKELNKTPRQCDFGKKYNLPSSTTITNKLEVNTWNDVLKICGVGKTKERNYNEEKVFNDLKQYIEDLGYIPTRKEYIKSGKQPSYSWFAHKFGSFENALNKIGYTGFKNDKELLEDIKKYTIKYGKTPISKHNSKEIYSSSFYYKRFNTNSWNEILKLAGVELNHFQGYTKEYAIEKLKEYYNILGVIPTREDFKNNNWIPNHGWYNDNFESYEHACLEAGLIDIIYTDKERIKISIDKLTQLANKLNRCPTVSEYEQIKHNGFVRRVLERKLNMKYNNICRKYLPKYELNHNMDKTKEELIEIILKLNNELHRPPLSDEVKPYYTFKLIQKLFNGLSYNQAIESLGLIPTGYTTLMRTEEVLLNEFEDYFKELGRIPYMREIDANKNIADSHTYLKYFGSIKNVCDILNIDYELYYKNTGAGIVCVDNNGEICKSLMEKEITNYFINNDIEYIKEYKYKEIIPNCSKRFDWRVKLNNQYYYIEYFGMFSRNSKHSITRKYRDRVKKKIKILYKNGFIDNCILIYPNDIKQKSLDEIFKPYIQDCLKKAS